MPENPFQSYFDGVKRYILYPQLIKWGVKKRGVVFLEASIRLDYGTEYLMLHPIDLTILAKLDRMD